MAQGRGKWYFVYTYRDMFTSMGGVIEHPEVRLDVTTEAEAVARGEVLWAAIQSEFAAKPEPKRTGSEHDAAAYLSNDYDTPRDPRVIYKIPLE